MSIILMQTETTYDVYFQDQDFTVTVTTDHNSGYYSYEVFDGDGKLVEGELEDDVINYLEENQ
jgi:hypothetical protein